MNSRSDDGLNRRGSRQENAEPRFLVIGQITKPHGVRGEVRVYPHTDLPERFIWLKEVYIGAADPQAVAVERVRLQNDLAILKLAGSNSRNDAEELRGELLYVPETQAIPLNENEYFLFELIDLSVQTKDGEQIGTLVEVIETGANNVFVIKRDSGEILIPDIPEVIESIDFDEKCMVVNLMAGL